MFYKYNSLSGRLATSSQLAAYFPQGFGDAPVLKPSSLDLPKVASVEAPIQHRAASSAVDTARYPKGYEKIKEYQKLFQSNPDIPIHLKAGPRDKILYFATVGLTVCGVLVSLNAIYGYINPKKKSE